MQPALYEPKLFYDIGPLFSFHVFVKNKETILK
uniref:Uncharacterized protein n=1 Tax=Rhizophora mucronata TaxID=61149 RepID=A0A2P2PF36_RHIMU